MNHAANPFEHNVWEGQRRLRPDDDVESLNHAASERILITGASGGVGTAAIQLAKRRGAEIVATLDADG